MDCTAKQAEDIINKQLTGKRLAHSFGTAHLAADMAVQLGEDVDRLYIAGLLHDIAKPFSHQKLRSVLKKYEVCPDEIALRNEALLHAPVAALLLEHEYGLRDKELLRAVKYHTTGASDLSLFEEILYAADFLDPMRSFPAQEQAWTKMAKSFTDGLLFITAFTIERVLSHHGALHLDSVAFYNKLLQRVQAAETTPPVFPNV